MGSEGPGLDRTAIMRMLEPEAVIGRDLVMMGEVGSTNDEVKRFGEEGVEEGVVVFEEAQTAGRGRGAAKWVSRAGEGLMRA
ncbi:MAG: hypothetical protein AAF591_21935 [Verrucomicrobiota bacterium]